MIIFFILKTFHQSHTQTVKTKFLNKCISCDGLCNGGIEKETECAKDQGCCSKFKDFKDESVEIRKGCNEPGDPCLIQTFGFGHPVVILLLGGKSKLNVPNLTIS